MKPIPYRAWQRFSDWYQGWRGGQAGLPARPTAREPVPNPPTTPHREYLIRTGQHLFTGEHLRLRRRQEPLFERHETAERLHRAALKELEERKARLTEVEAAWVGRALTERRHGEERAPTQTVRRRRERERDRQIAAASGQVAAAQAAADDAESEAAAVRRELDREHQNAKLRVERIHEHLHRRMAAYRRRLVQVHPNGAWVNDQTGFARPEVPGWAETRKTAEASVSRPAAEPPPPDPDTGTRVIAIGDRLVLGSSTPPADVLIAAPDVTAEHCVITRAGQEFRLRASSEGAAVFVDGVAVRRARLRPGESFEVAGSRYEFTEDGRGLIPSSPECDLIVHDLSATSGTPRLTEMSLVQREGSILVILGPSGAGKSSLFAALMGELDTEPGGRVYFKGHQLGPHTDQIRDMLGFVPQSDDVYRSLRVRRLLEFALRLRQGGRGSRAFREERIRHACEQVGLEDQIDQLVSTLSGGQRRRASIAVDMIAEPDLLLLDEPTSGLDPGMDREIMSRLRKYASPDDGAARRTVIVVTHSTEHLSPDDTALVVAGRGRPVYCGPPGAPLLEDLGVDSYAELMKKLGTDEVDVLVERYRKGARAAEAEREAGLAAAEAIRPRNRGMVRFWRLMAFLRQLPVLLRRQTNLTISRGLSKNPRDHVFEPFKAALLAALPLMIAGAGAALAAWVSSDTGLSDPGQVGANRDAPTALNLLVTLSVLGGQALTYNDLVTDFPIIKREYRTGVHPGAVVLSKWLVFALIAVLQSMVAAAVYVWIAPAPDYAHAFGPVAELGVNLSMTAIAAMTLGLMIGAVSTKTEQAVSLSTGAAIVQVALNGATVDITGFGALNSLSTLLPARRGLAAIGSSIDFDRITSLRDDAMWSADLPQWIENVGVLALLTGVYFAVAVKALTRRLGAPG